MKRIILSILAIILATLACGTPVVPNPQPTGTLTSDVPGPDFDFTISVEYAILGVADTYAAAGVRYAKLQNVFAIWGNIEPEAGKFQWGPLDELVLEYQQAGFTGLQMDLSALSPWASSMQPSLGNQGDPFPKAEYLDDYAAFVSTLVERYDRDGIDDMPGLLYPIRDYGIEREFTGFWPGSAEEYIRLLRIAYPAIKAADPDAKVMLVALLMTDIFDGYPSATEIQQRLSHDPYFMRKGINEIRAILAACDAYDMIDFHSLGDYTEIPLTADWIRLELQSNGCAEKPIWIGDAFPMSGLVGYGGFTAPIPFAPVTLDTRDAVVKLLQSIADPSAEAHATGQSWLYAETAIGLTRKIVVSASSGLRGINVGNLEDWKTGNPGIDKTAVAALGGSMFMGLTDTTNTNEKPGGTLPYTGQDWSKVRRPGERRPAWYALSLITEKIGNFTNVQQIDPASLTEQGLRKDIWAYRFETQSGPVWVLWYDDGALHLPGEISPSITINLPFEAESALLTITPTVIGVSKPETQTIFNDAGIISIRLGATPIFVQETP